VSGTDQPGQVVVPESPVSLHWSSPILRAPPFTALNWAAVSLPFGKSFVAFAGFFLFAIVVPSIVGGEVAELS
jgi:hypothetical protein